MTPHDQIAKTILDGGLADELFPNCMMAIDQCAEVFSEIEQEAYLAAEKDQPGSTVAMIALAVGVRIGREQSETADQIVNEAQDTLIDTAIDSALLVIGALHRQLAKKRPGR